MFSRCRGDNSQSSCEFKIKPIKFMIDSGATVNVIPATFIKDNKMEHLLKKGKKLDITVYGGKKVRTERTTCQQKKSDSLSHGCE